MTSTLRRYALIALLVVAALAGGLAYRSHVYGAGVDAGLHQAHAAAQEARLLASRADALAGERAAANLQRTLQSLKDSHDRTTGDLKAALAASDLRVARLGARIASLLDEAAGVRAGPPADPGRTGEAADPAPADSTVGLLIETVNANYAICRADQARLAGLQGWYEDLRRGKSSAVPVP